MNKRIVGIYKDSEQLDEIAHRAGVHYCPHCEWDDDRYGQTFDELPHLREVLLDSRRGITNAVILISACPSCKELSWVHVDINHFLYYTGHSDNKELKYIYTAVRAEYDRRVALCKKTWQESKCRTCKNIKEIDDGYLYPIVRCPGSSGCATDDCDRYVKTRRMKTRIKKALEESRYLKELSTAG